MFPLLLTLLAMADEPDAPVEVAPVAPTIEAVPIEATLAPTASPDILAESLQMAARLQAAEAHEEARALLRWVIAQDPPKDTRAAAREQLATLPPERGGTAPTVLLGGWQMLAGAWLVGPNNIWIAESAERVPPGPGWVFAGGLAGGAAGLGGTLWYTKHYGMTTGKANNIFAGEMLGAFNGLGLTLLVDDGGDWIPAGLLLGTVGGGAVGYYAASKQPEAGVAAATTSGAFWGAGTGLLLLSPWYFEGESVHDVLPIVLAADLGALAGNGLARVLKLKRNDVALGNLFGIAGGLTMGGFAVATQNFIIWTPGAVASAVEISAIAGGAAGIVISRKLEAKAPNIEGGALLHGTPGDLRLGIPLPSVLPENGGYHTTVSLVDYRF